MAFAPQVPDNRNKDEPTDHVDGVHAGHAKDNCAILITPWGQMPFIDKGKETPFKDHHTDQEDEAQDGSDDEPNGKGPAIAMFHRGLGNVHRNTADQQHNRHNQPDDLINFGARVAP